MHPSTSLLILGAGGHGRVVADAARAQGCWAELRAADRDARHHGMDLLPGIRVQAFEAAVAPGTAVHVAISLAAFREREATSLSLPLATIVHPRATVSPHARLGEGCFVGPNTVLAPCTGWAAASS